MESASFRLGIIAVIRLFSESVRMTISEKTLRHFEGLFNNNVNLLRVKRRNKSDFDFFAKVARLSPGYNMHFFGGLRVNIGTALYGIRARQGCPCLTDIRCISGSCASYGFLPTGASAGWESIIYFYSPDSRTCGYFQIQVIIRTSWNKCNLVI